MGFVIGVGSMADIIIRSGGAVAYLLLARFNAANQGYANGQVLNTAAEGVTVGQLTVAEVDGTLAIVGNECAFTAQGTPVWGDLGFPSHAITRALGRGLFGIINLATWEEMGLGWDDVEAVDDPDNLIHALQANATDGRIDVEGGLQVYSGLALNTDYRWCLLLGGYDINETPYYTGQVAANYAYGCWYFVEVGGTWHLAWTNKTDNTATLYAIFTSLDAVGTLDDMLVPDVDLSAVQEAITNFSSFTAPNGTPLENITPEVGGVWTIQDDGFDIQGNEAHCDVANAAATVDSGISDAIIDDTIVSGPGGATGNVQGIEARRAGIVDKWRIGVRVTGAQFVIQETTGGVSTDRASAGQVIGSPHNLRAVLDGQAIDGYIDGGNKISYALAAAGEFVTTHGIHTRYVGGIEHDNFAVYPRTAAIYDTVLDAV